MRKESRGRRGSVCDTMEEIIGELPKNKIEETPIKAGIL